MSRSQVQVLVTAMFRLLFVAFLFTAQIAADEELTDAILPRLDPAVQNEFYQTLETVDFLFGKERIVYWATGGSLLGAIRHGEMIPWDDDIDLALFIDDLGKVVSLRPELEERGACFACESPLCQDLSAKWKADSPSRRGILSASLSIYRPLLYDS